MTKPFDVAWVQKVRFGVLAAVPLPAGLEPVPEEVLARLAPEERAMVTAERGRRQIEYAGGRVAAREAARHAGVDWPALLSGSEREPLAPPGRTVSISHKNDLAVALVADAADGHVGIDLEGDGKVRLTIASKVCRPEELAELDALATDAERWRAVMTRFAVKEAIYKAVFPIVRHFFGFQAARVEVPSGAATLLLPPEDPLVATETELLWLSADRVLAMVRARR